MKKNNALLALAALILATVVILNLQVSIQQCIDYKCYSLRLPLYLKMLDFFDRHYNYKLLARDIIKGAHSEEEKVIKILDWTFNNIKRQPEGLPVVDDHIWHIIVRGYGTEDQFQDVFTTLCNYSGLDAYFSYLYSKDKKHMISISLVYIKNKWRLFDAFRGVYFVDKNGEFCNIETIKNNEWVVGKVKDDLRTSIDYKLYTSNLSLITEKTCRRAGIQSPINRLLFEIKKLRK